MSKFGTLAVHEATVGIKNHKDRFVVAEIHEVAREVAPLHSFEAHAVGVVIQKNRRYAVLRHVASCKSLKQAQGCCKQALVNIGVVRWQKTTNRVRLDGA